MNRNLKFTVAVGVVLIGVGAAVVVWRNRAGDRHATEAELEREFERMPPCDSDLGEMRDMKLSFAPPPAAKAKKTPTETPDSAPTEAEKAEAEAEQLVEAFDKLTDSWMEGVRKTAPTMKEIDEFAEQFRKLPDGRKDECVHRALNLIPDENVMLLAGILMDKTQDTAIVKTVFNDVLNRAEAVKKPILEVIFKDKNHPCWPDVAWIFDVTGKKADAGEKPAAQE